MTINTDNLIKKLNSNQSSILEEFKSVKDSLASMTNPSGGVTIWIIEDKLGKHASNKPLMPIFSSLLESHSDNDLVLALISKPDEKMDEYKLGYSTDYPIERYYISFSEDANAIGLLVKSEAVSETNTGWVQANVVNWNNGTPTTDLIADSEDNLVMVVDFWIGDSEMTAEQLNSYYKQASSEWWNYKDTYGLL